MKKKNFLRIGFLSGIIPLIGGLIIFFAWVIARNLFGYDMSIMTVAGLYWILFSIPIALTGLTLLILFIVRNKKQHIKKSIISILLVLINIPTTYYILHRVDIIDNRAYLSIYNQTKQDNVEVVFKGSYFQEDLGKINSKDYKVVYFTPKYTNLSHEMECIVDSFFLEIKYNDGYKKVLCPAIYQSDFKKLVLNDKFQLIESK